MQSNNRPETRLATRLAFIAAGFAVACWAPLVPYAKHNVGVSDGGLGLLLLCFGLGSLVAMPLTGWLSGVFGSRRLVVVGGLGLVAFLPLLPILTSFWWLAVVLIGFGAALGALDVAMNIHAVEVEQDSDQPLMSGFHAMFSIGGFLGAGSITLLLSSGVTAAQAAGAGAVATLIAVVFAWPRLLNARPEGSVSFVLPKGVVLQLAGLAAIMFLAEGSVLDWGALLLVSEGHLATDAAGFGYMVFAGAMAIGRLAGDRIVGALGGRKVLLSGGSLAVAGLALMVIAPEWWLALLGFALVGIGASNIVPVLFSAAGRQRLMPAALAIAGVSTIGYAGVLLGPALFGLLSQSLGVAMAFACLALLTAVVPLAGRVVESER